MKEINKKILITGAAGFIGFSLAKDLLSKGYKIYGIDNFDNYYSTSSSIIENSSLHFRLGVGYPINIGQNFIIYPAYEANLGGTNLAGLNINLSYVR